MASRETKKVGKVGRPSVEEKQKRLTEEGKEGGKKVIFQLSEERLEKEEKKRVTEICKEIIGSELNRWEEKRRNVNEAIKELKERIKGYEERMSRTEARMGEVEEWRNKEIRNKEEEEQSVGKISSRGEGADSARSVGSEREDSCGRSEISVGSSLSTREVERIRKWVTDKDREERRRNIILKGVKIPRDIGEDRKRGVD